MSEKGSIFARLSTAGGTMPVEGAKVTIIYGSQPGNMNMEFDAGNNANINNQVNVQYFTTDASGITGELQVDTPDREESLIPGNGGILPFATVSIRADHPQYQSVLVEGVQVFSGRSSLQQINMIPLPDVSTPINSLIIITVPPQNL